MIDIKEALKCELIEAMPSLIRKVSLDTAKSIAYENNLSGDEILELIYRLELIANEWSSELIGD